MKPAIFNTDMVRAILALIKENTRRPFSKYLKKVIDTAYAMGEIGSNGIDSDFDDSDKKYLMAFAPYQVGDIIYVRETFNTFSDITMDKEIGVIYKADNEMARIPCEYNRSFEYVTDGKRKPSIHMPKEYARLFLRVKDVRIERLDEISEDDAEAEGLECIEFQGGAEYRTLYGIGVDEQNGKFISDSPKESFKELWESIYGNGSFDNRYVWVIEFEQISKEEAYRE